MKVDQILIRPSQAKLIIQYLDDMHRPNRIVLDTAGDARVAAILADAEQRIPSPADHPQKAQIEKEITRLESRLVELRKSIGQT